MTEPDARPFATFTVHLTLPLSKHVFRLVLQIDPTDPFLGLTPEVLGRRDAFVDTAQLELPSASTRRRTSIP